MTGLVILIVLVAVALAAPRYGVDSRPGAAGARHTVGGDLRALVARVRATRPVRTPR
ncbi:MULTISPECIES: hypothetical protein [unclassified Pseudonocardia]|jgi:hypothetical protein|uniref:hypothetical protein n=1 Tax=unclassified Pseudonocardia TaxID=2619320 RepID=UPI001AC320A1|nr:MULTISPECIES: hypothetical protein [unclassified Pseudonocardia]MBN9100148.1 hypothetical protein [Pseudonocardia sp.]